MPIYPGNTRNLGQTKNSSGKFRSGEPRYLVMHYTAGGSGKGSADYLFRPHKPASSAHFCVDRNGDVYQLADTTTVTWHAGKSFWRGVSMLNSHAIGIEIANFGFWRPEAGLPPTASVAERAGWIKLAHKNDPSRQLWWEPYAEPQMKAVEELTTWILQTHKTIVEIVGHDDIAPGRKSDPGPAFPMDRFRKLLHPDSEGSKIPAGLKGEVQITPERKPTFVVTSQTLNMRGGPGTGFQVILELDRGQQVELLQDKGEWSLVQLWHDGKRFEGWVYDAYLAHQ